jgi:hypothetical protein
LSKIKTAINAYALNPAVKAAATAGRAAAPAGPVKGVARPLVTPPVKGRVVPGVTGGTPGAPGGAPANPMPWDAAYEGASDAAIANRDASYASIDNAVTAAKQSYGFDDLSDPFSKIALLKESFANAQRGSTNSMAAAGQLYSGALGNAQNANQHNYDVNYDATRRSYDQTLGDLAARRTQAKNTADDTIAGANLTRVQTALANRPDPATLPAPAKPKAPAPKPKAPAKGKGK